MASLDSIEIKNKQRSGFTEVKVADTPIAFRIKYKGWGSVTSVTVTTATSIVLVSAEGTAGTATTVTVAFATYTTMGAVADAINNSQYWECKILDALRSDASASKLVDGVITVGGGYYDAKVDTSAALQIAYRCAYDRNVGDRVKGAHRVALKSFTYYGDLTAAANKVQVWEYDPVRQSETQVYQATSVDTTSTTINFANGEGEITSDWGNELIVVLTTASGLADGSLSLEVSYDRE